ncbi:MAG: ABC transporter permease [Gemmatimonadales bacterium]
MPRLPSGVRSLFRLPFRTLARIGRDVDDEVAFHLDKRAEELTAAGRSPEEARAEALRRFGDVDDLRAFCRTLERPAVVRSRVREWLTDLGQDLRFAGRQVRRLPGFALVAVVTLALGIGATTTIYCAVHDILLKPLPYRDADRLVAVEELAISGQASMMPTRDVVDAWRSGARSLEGIVEFTRAQWMLSVAGEPELVGGVALEPTLLPFLGVRPLLGRPFTSDDARLGSPPVALVGEAVWRRRFGASRGALGRDITLDGHPYTVIGVMPRDFGIALFYFSDLPQVFVPLLPEAGTARVAALGRLRTGVSAEQAARELGTIPADDPTLRGPHSVAANVVMVRDEFEQWYRHTLTLLMAAAGLVLLIACANVGNLQLVRGWSRQREFGIRTAIGAGRGRLMRQVLTESVVIGLAGGGLGAFLAWRAVPLLAALRPRTIQMVALTEVRVDPGVLGFTLGVTILTGLLIGLAPALLATERQVSESLRGSAHAASGRPATRRVRAALVVTEIGISTVLLVCAGLLVRSLVAQARADEGLYPTGLLSVDLTLPALRLPSPAARLQVLQRAVDRVRGIPGIQAASSAMFPPWGIGIILKELNVEGRSLGPGPKPGMMEINLVAPEYFRTVEIPLLTGRAFSEDTSAHETVVGEAFARQYLPAGRALGARIRFGNAGPWLTVVGVVADPRLPGEAGAPPRPIVYQPFAGTGTRGTILARGEDPVALLPFVARAITMIDPAIHVVQARTVHMVLAERRASPRFLMTLLASFAGLALVLAAVGLYGVVAFSVRQRTHEIGVRVALGASAEDVLAMVVRHALGLALLGIAIGLAGAAAATRLIRSWLYGVGPLDAATFVAVAGILALVALAATYVPARAALRVDPVEALRADG